MNRNGVMEQAKSLATLLPTLMRQLSAGEDDPAVELPLAQLKVCSVLYQGARPMSSIGRELGVSLSAMTQIANRLERAGLVERVAQGKDRRVRRLQLTKLGSEMMRRRENARIHSALAVMGHLAPTARKEVLATLQTLIDACIAAHGQDGHRKQLDHQLLALKAVS